MMLRAVAAAVLTEGRTTTILNPSFCDDALASLRVAEGLGAHIERGTDRIHIRGELRPAGSVLSCGESGLSLRMFAAIAALGSQEVTLTGEGTLLSRPVGMIERPLRELGAQCETRRGRPPIRIAGPIRGGEAEVDGGESSQFLTGLLLALPRVSGQSKVQVRNLKSRSYVEMTLDFLRGFKVEVARPSPDLFVIRGPQPYDIGTYVVEGDWSGAAFLLTAGALAGVVRVRGLRATSAQADREVLRTLKAAGAEVMAGEDAVEVRGRSLRAFRADLTDSPDLFPPLAALACHCRGISYLEGAQRLRHKESDRAAALGTELTKLGGDIAVRGNTLVVKGTELRGGAVEAHRDHRIAMALAVAALRARDEVAIEGAECVSKSYPRFFEDLTAVGGDIHE